ncbi:hypothetical protein [Flavobacterium sp. I3-2]|uniref:hypothetical protein n=1 Tax=Flavobacterium sp. I3-2 TaxID=2748319 RepID=UPI001C4A0580|nr:hypothetical protein [Flavobacterium sp. I3-2]
MKKLLYFIIFFYGQIVFSQCDDKLMSGTFENIKYILNCPTYTFNKQSNDFKNIDDTLKKRNIKLVKDDYQIIDSLVRYTILKDASPYFKEKLVFSSFEKTYNDSIGNFKNISPKVDLNICKAKYSIYYYFEPIENVKYCIGYAFDKDLRWLNENRRSIIIAYENYDDLKISVEYPSYQQVSPFEKTTICELKKLGKKYLNKEIENLELIFLKDRFYWSMNEKEHFYRGKNSIKNVLINPFNLKEYRVVDVKIYVDF